MKRSRERAEPERNISERPYPIYYKNGWKIVKLARSQKQGARSKKETSIQQNHSLRRAIVGSTRVARRAGR